jgi:hypothetical protein
MKPPIAVCLLTSDRPDYTARTLRSFEQHNRRDPRMILLHADDGSQTHRNVNLAHYYGFKTVTQNSVRRGWMLSRTALFEQAALHANWILFLENDIDTLRPFPWALFDAVRKTPGIYCLRLYGRFKDVARTDKCLETHKRRGHKPVQWKPWRDAPEASQVGEIHWSAQPSVTRAQELLSLHKTGKEPTGSTVRVKKNVTSHFGLERTTPQRSKVAA